MSTNPSTPKRLNARQFFLKECNVDIPYSVYSLPAHELFQWMQEYGDYCRKVQPDLEADLPKDGTETGQKTEGEKSKEEPASRKILQIGPKLTDKEIEKYAEEFCTTSRGRLSEMFQTGIVAGAKFAREFYESLLYGKTVKSKELYPVAYKSIPATISENKQCNCAKTTFLYIRDGKSYCANCNGLYNISNPTT